MPQLTKPLKFLVIGAGQRGAAYAAPVTETTTATIHAVAEPVAYKRQVFGQKYIWGRSASGKPAPGQEFSDWKAWLQWEVERRQRQSQGDRSVPDGVDGVFVCTLDATHVEIMCAIAPLNLHVLCEKPLATSLADCLAIYRAFYPASGALEQSKIFSIGHVLRYSPHNLLLRKLVLIERVIGDVLSIEHTEPVGWWHFAHSYVRGNWRRETSDQDGSLLTKCCHDIDFLLWMLSTPPPAAAVDTPSHLPSLITSIGSRNQFRRSRKPAAAGNATNCLSCPIERECQYSAVQLYYDNRLAKRDFHWLEHAVATDIEDVLNTSGTEAARQHLFERLGEDYDRKTTADADIAARPWYGRCVYESDNDVCDDQLVTIKWDEEDSGRPGKTAVLHMIANTEKECERRGYIYGTDGELSYDGRTIRYFSFVTRQWKVLEVPRVPHEEKKSKSHGGGDYGLARAFVDAVDAVENRGADAREAQVQYVGCTLEDAVQSHALVFAAEEARRDRKIVRWQDWWRQKTGEGTNGHENGSGPGGT